MKNKLKYLILSLGLFLAVAPAIVSRDLPVTTIGGRECYVYEVKKGVNIYDVAKELKISTGVITGLNPSAADGLRPGMHLYFPKYVLDGGPQKSKPTQNVSTVSEPEKTAEVIPATPLQPAKKVETAQPVAQEPAKDLPATYTVKKGESLYGISHKFGLTVEELIAMNPSAVYGISNGNVLILNPEKAKAAQIKGSNDNDADDDELADASTDMRTPPQQDYSLIPSERRISQMYVTKVEDNDGEYGDEVDPTDGFALEAVDTVNMAVILPFMLDHIEQNKTAQLFTEFYKGLMLAVNKLETKHTGHHVNLYAFDSAASVDTIAAIMRRPEMRDMSVIIGPDNEAQLKYIADAMNPGTVLFNVFNVRSTLWESNPQVIQANIPHSPMLEKAVNEFFNMYGDYTPVFIARIDGEADKDPFTSMLKQKLDARGIAYEDIAFKNLLSTRDLEKLATDSNYVFVPISGSRSEFAKFSEAIRKFGESRVSSSTRVFGYPDWITFRGEYLTRLCELEATIYTRFYYDVKEPESRDFNELFKETYGCEMLDAAPVQGVLGYDTGIYLLGLLKDHGADFKSYLSPFNGLQSALDFSGDAKNVNNALIIVTFTNGGNVIKTTLE